MPCSASFRGQRWAHCLGVLGGVLLRAAGQRGWSSEEFAGPAVLSLSLLTYLCAIPIGANGFVAAFVAGSTFGASAGRRGATEVYYVEQTCGLASMISWLLFGHCAMCPARPTRLITCVRRSVWSL
jgi:sodium/hydrogen antiporter